jgi:hypothetical protein
MRFYGKAEQAANSILQAFQNPASLPAALAPIFIRRRDNVPCRAWSWANQLIVALRGHSDARGYRQWQEVGRHVRKGERSFEILVPMTKRVERENPQTGESESVTAVFGFKSAAVFGLAQTEGEPLPEVDTEVTRWIESLPLLDVAREWGLSVETFNGRAGKAQGWYVHGEGIALGVENLSTWAHEMVHAADDRLGTLLRHERKWARETVAELGGAVLLTCLGHDHAADMGGAWEYVQHWCAHDGIEPITACQRMLKRTCDAVALILDTAERLAEPHAVAV